MLQSERNFFLEKGLIGELVVWHLRTMTENKRTHNGLH